MSEYAPEYTKNERIVIAIKMAAWALPLYLGAQFWFFDWLHNYSNNANCYHYGNITGVHLVFYGLFVFMPLSFGIILFLLEGRDSIKVIKLRQDPLPNEKVFKPTKYKYGIAAMTRPAVTFCALAFLLGTSIWGGFQAHDLTQNIKPCTAEQIHELEK